MKNDLINRERRLRRQAEAKGLGIQKKTKESNMGYLVVRADSNVVVAGYHHYDNLLTIEEAEAFVREYEVG